MTKIKATSGKYIIRKAYQLPNGYILSGWTQDDKQYTWQEAQERRLQIRSDLSNLDRGKVIVTIEDAERVAKGDRVKEPIKKLLARLRG